MLDEQHECQHEVMLERFGAALSYCLFQMTEPDDKYRALLALAIERHTNFHDKGANLTDCKNENCITICKILNNSLVPQVVVNPFSIQMLNGFQLRLMPLKGEAFAIRLEPKVTDQSPEQINQEEAPPQSAPPLTLAIPEKR